MITEALPFQTVNAVLYVQVNSPLDRVGWAMGFTGPVPMLGDTVLTACQGRDWVAQLERLTADGRAEFKALIPMPIGQAVHLPQGRM